MAVAQADEPTVRKPLRLWPGVVVVTVQWLVWLVAPVIVPEAMVAGVFGGLIGGLVVVLWWVLFSRAPWLDRLGGAFLMIVALLATPRILDVSIATGAMGMLFPIYAVPVLSLAFVVWAVASRNLASGPRRATMVATILFACGAWALVRTNGVTGDFNWDFAWRWSETHEERLLARAGEEPTAFPPAPAATDLGAEWPGFRGRERDSVVRGVRIETDWTASPPVELWRRPIGPGWSSFAVRGDLLYTQEQRGDDEIVAAYSVTTGEPVWMHRDTARFWEAMAGAGPRGTPTLSGERVYTFGATGIVNALDAADGSVMWSRDAAADAGVTIPGWGFASSPLVIDDLVIVAVAGQLVAYELATGKPRWFGPAGSESYGSPHLLTIEGVPQVLLLNGSAMTSVAPADGTLLWEHGWPGFHSLQPALTAGGDVLFSASGNAGGAGTRRLTVARGPGGWTAEERWTSIGLKPYFNDFVVHEGHAFGFDGRILACIDVEHGERQWKGGRYGHGQLVLLPEQDLLLVLSEQGELALVAATPNRFTELARFPAIEGKTWNHPVLVGNVLLVRNGREMAAFRLPLAGV
ncbi:MAG TPA: PQQ-binding-like beta-propeller repeat protein [Acidobacteriota bacterium]